MRSFKSGWQIGAWAAVIGAMASVGIPAGARAAAIGLQESFDAALKRSETLGAQEAQVEAAQARSRQALGSILPNVSATGSYLVQDQPSDPLAASFFPKTQPTVKATLTQPLFRGLREFAALRQAKGLAVSQEHQLEAARIQLYRDVSQAFHAVLALEEDAKNLKTQLGLYVTQLGDIRKRVSSGQSSPTDGLSIEQAQAGVDAQLRATNGQIRGARETYAFLTGLPADTVLTVSDTPLPRPQSVDSLVAQLDERPDLKALGARRDSAQEGVAIAKGGHWPSADLMANYYFVRPSPIFNEIKWDIQATLTLPIYSGGIVASQVREAAAADRLAELELVRARRQAEQDLRTIHATYLSDLEQIEVRAKALEIADRNYSLLKRDYQRNLTRSLDVLQGLTSFQDNRRALSQARFTARHDLVRLQTATAKAIR